MAADATSHDVMPWRALAVVALVLAAAATSLDVIIWIRGIERTAGLLSASTMMSVALLLLPVFAQWQWPGQRSSSGSEITLDDSGLTYGYGATKISWPWQQLKPFRLHEPKPFRSWTGLRQIGIGVHSERPATRFLRMWCEPPIIADAFDAPLANIAGSPENGDTATSCAPRHWPTSDPRIPFPLGS